MPLKKPWSLWDTVILDLKENDFPNLITLADALRRDPGDVPAEVREFLAERAKAGAIKRSGKKGSSKLIDAFDQHVDDALLRAAYEFELKQIENDRKAAKFERALKKTSSRGAKPAAKSKREPKDLAALRTRKVLLKHGIDLEPSYIRKRYEKLERELIGGSITKRRIDMPG